MNDSDETPVLAMNEQYASKFAKLALAHVSREFPNKLDHVLLGENDVQSPRALHPIFFGSFDWHSCVHGYWLLARLCRRFPHIPEAKEIRELFNTRLIAENVAVECLYAAHPARGGFERPYGWAWLLMLQAELLQHDAEGSERWVDVLQPLADVFVSRFHEFLPKATYPIRTGTHYNTAFAIALTLEYASVSGDKKLVQLLRETARRWYTNDRNTAAWEPSGDDFLSPVLVEAECMRRALLPTEFQNWLEGFLPDITQGIPATLFTPATVSDRSDGKIAHLDGLNLSRAWCWRMLALSLVGARRDIAMRAAEMHLRASLPHVAGDYMGEHWLATYALLALETGTGR